MADKEKPKDKVTKQSDKKAVSGKTPAKVVPSVEKAGHSSASESPELLTILKSMQDSLIKQGEKMDDLGHRLTKVENYEFDYYEEGDGYDEECDFYCEQSQPVGLQEKRTDVDSSKSQKRVAEEPSRFQSMAKRFRSIEEVDEDIDPILAENINDLFHNGIDEERYEELMKDPKNARPGNCEGLTVVKTNRLIWDAVTHKSRLTDKKLQNIESSVVKAATIMAKTVNSMAPLEQENQALSPLIDQCNNVLALLGHTNRQINLTRRDLLKPDLREDYAHLCNHSVPYTSELFGDDVGKQAREIEDCNKIGNRLQRGGFRGRSGFKPRFRGNGRGFWRGRGGSAFGGTGAFGPNQVSPKNLMRRGQGRPQK